MKQFANDRSEKISALDQEAADFANNAASITTSIEGIDANLATLEGEISGARKQACGTSNLQCSRRGNLGAGL